MRGCLSRSSGVLARGRGYGTGVSEGRMYRYRSEVGGTWWAALGVVTVLLGVVGRPSSGFWSPFLWCVVGFVLGSLLTVAVSATRVPARSEDEAFARMPSPATRREDRR